MSAPKGKPVDLNALEGQEIERAVTEYSAVAGHYVAITFKDGRVIVLALNGMFVAVEIA